MTKEEAMKIMNEWNKCEELVIRENTDYDKTIYIQRKEAIETVLNMLKNLQRKNKRLTQTNRTYKGIISKQNKQIDLMAKAMDKIQDPQVCKYCDNKINLNHGYCVDAGKCKEGIKQYFERKSEE